MITVPSQYTETYITRSMARPAITAKRLIGWSGLVSIVAGVFYAQEALCDTLRLELAPWGIQVSMI